jgi:TetR/AcrR family transcriptional regulator
MTPPTASSDSTAPTESWAERAADRSPTVQRSRSRSIQQAKVIVDAARRLIVRNGGSFTTQELVKEAGVALQTFYRQFAGKDQLLIAVLEDMIAEAAVQYEERARDLPDPVARLRSYIKDTLTNLGGPGGGPPAGFVVSEHWRLHQIFPEEVSHAMRPWADMVLRDIRAAEAAGLLHPRDAEQDAWLVTRLVTAVFHHYAFAPSDRSAEEIGEQVWGFCLAALGGSTVGSG